MYIAMNRFEVHRGREAIAAFWDGVRSLSPVIRLVVTGPVRVAIYADEP